MSSAVYPLGMKSMPASGYNHKSTTYNKQYVTWKGTGINSNPVGTAPGHIRPLTNKDPGNVFPTGFGLPRPIKHFRKGRVIPVPPVEANPLYAKDPYNGNIDITIDEAGLINYNLNRFVKSSKGTSLGGGAGGNGLLSQMMYMPGGFSIKENSVPVPVTTNWVLEYNNNQGIIPFNTVKQSYTGQYIVTTSQNSSIILTSNDYGKTWNQHLLEYLSASWGIAISGTGQYQIVASLFNTNTINLYRSEDYGSTFTDISFNLDSLYNESIIYDNLNISADGSIVSLVINGNASYGDVLIYKSTDYGVTFTFMGLTIPTCFFPSSSMSSDGTYISLAGNSPDGGTFIFNGSIWTIPTTPVLDFCYPIRISSSGQYQTALSNLNSNIYYSTNYGVDWNTSNGTPNNVKWWSLAITDDGSSQIALGKNYTGAGVFYISNDYGANWRFLSTPPGYSSQYYYQQGGLSMSYDGAYATFVHQDIFDNNTIYTNNDIFNNNNNNNNNLINNECKTCEGTAIVSDYYPNKGYLTENPEPNTTNPVLCCNPEYKAKRRAIYASTNLNKNYYTTHAQYLQNRCKTYDQKAFNFLSYKTFSNPEYQSNPYYLSTSGSSGPVPGSPLSLGNTYLANCQPNAQIYDATENAMISQMLTIMLNRGILTQQDIDTFYTLNINSIQGFYMWLNQLTDPPKTEALKVFTAYLDNPYTGMPLTGPTNPIGCQFVVYKPNNYQFAKQGAVDSSTRMLKLNVDTISTNAASIQNYNNTGPLLVNANELYAGNDNNIMNLYKNKAPNCNSPTVFQFQNKKLCYYKKLPQYQNPASQPSPYRYYPATYRSSNHFSQSPNTYNTPGR